MEEGGLGTTNGMFATHGSGVAARGIHFVFTVMSLEHFKQSFIAPL